MTAQVRALAALLYLLPALALFGLFVLWPAVQVAWLSLQRWNGYGPETFVGLGNYTFLAGDALFRTSLEHSLLWEAGAMIVAPVFGLALALVLVRTRASTVVLSIIFFPALLPATVIAALASLIYSPLAGPLNSGLTAIGLGALAADWLGDPHLALPALFAAWLWGALGIATAVLWSGLQGIGGEFREIALVEGAGRLWQLGHVILPGIRRSFAIVVVIEAALAGETFDLIFVTTGGGPGYATMLLPVDMYGRAFGGKTGEGAAVACIQLLILLVAVLLVVPIGRGESLVGTEASRHRGAPLPTVLAVGVVAVLMLPLAWLPFAALTSGRSFVFQGPSLDPHTWSLSSITTVWQAGMGGAIFSSLGFALLDVAVTLLLALPAGFVLARMHSRLRFPLLVLLVAGLLAPTPVLIVPLFSLLRDLHLLDTVWGILLPELSRALPFAILILWGALSGARGEVLDAAVVDGAGVLQQIVSVAAPLVRPALYAAAIWTFVTSWNEYLLPTVVSQDGTITTVPTLLAGFVGKFDTQLGTLAAGCLFAMAPTLLLYTVLRGSAAAGIIEAEGRVR